MIGFDTGANVIDQFNQLNKIVKLVVASKNAEQNMLQVIIIALFQVIKSSD